MKIKIVELLSLTMFLFNLIYVIIIIYVKSRSYFISKIKIKFKKSVKKHKNKTKNKTNSKKTTQISTKNNQW